MSRIKPCRNWQQAGQCRFGNACHFAHSVPQHGVPQHGVQPYFVGTPQQPMPLPGAGFTFENVPYNTAMMHGMPPGAVVQQPSGFDLYAATRTILQHKNHLSQNCSYSVESSDELQQTEHHSRDGGGRFAFGTVAVRMPEAQFHDTYNGSSERVRCNYMLFASRWDDPRPSIVGGAASKPGEGDAETPLQTMNREWAEEMGTDATDAASMFSENDYVFTHACANGTKSRNYLRVFDVSDAGALRDLERRIGAAFLDRSDPAELSGWSLHRLQVVSNRKAERLDEPLLPATLRHRHQWSGTNPQRHLACDIGVSPLLLMASRQLLTDEQVRLVANLVDIPWPNWCAHIVEKHR